VFATPASGVASFTWFGDVESASVVHAPWSARVPEGSVGPLGISLA
jgi:hypothetical protein